MGVTWRRLSERFKEKTGSSKSNSLGTSNKRNSATLHELGLFAAQMRRMEKDLRTLKQNAEAAVKTTKDTLAFPLPRVYTDEASMAAQAQLATGAAGGGLTAGVVSAVTLHAGRKLEDEVFTPLVRWQSTYAFLVARNKDLENLRLEVGSRKRTVEELSSKAEALHAKLGGGGADGGKAQAQLDRTTLKLQHKQGKLMVAQEQYVRQEEELHCKLAELAKDAIWVRNYACAALSTEGSMLCQAGEAVGMLDAAALAAAAPQPAPVTPGAPMRSTQQARTGGVAGAAGSPGGSTGQGEASPFRSPGGGSSLAASPTARATAGLGCASEPALGRATPPDNRYQSRNPFNTPFLEEPVLAPAPPTPAATETELPAAGARVPAGGSAWSLAPSPEDEPGAAEDELDMAPAPPRHLPRLPPLLASGAGRKEGPGAALYASV